MNTQKKRPAHNSYSSRQCRITRARARGVEEASDCEFITFVDGDDTLQKRSFEILYKYIDDTIDIAIGLYDINKIHERTVTLESKEYINRLIRMDKGMPHAMWGKLSDEKFSITSHLICHEKSLLEKMQLLI